MIAPILATTLAAAPVAGLLGYRQLKRAKFSRRLRITTPNGIDESGFVHIGGIDQWISVRGDDRANPVILEIHGGPGASNHVFMPRTREWERHFTIVRWDLRGAGKTFANTGPDGQGELSLNQLYRDALEVTEHVRARFGVSRLCLVASSFGSVLGLRLARNRPDLYSAYVGTDQNIIGGGHPHAAYQGLITRLEAAGKRKQLAAATAMGPDATQWSTEQWSAFNKLVTTTDPLLFDTMKTVVVRSIWFSPTHRLRDLPKYMKAMSFSERLGASAMCIDEYAEGTEFQLPFFVFQGDSDVLTPPEAAQRFFGEVTAPHKEFALIKGASHFASFRHPEQFLELMMTKVRPVIDRVSATR